jgi:hypothetical protein
MLENTEEAIKKGQSLDYPFLIASSVFSNVYLSVSLDCPFCIASSVFSNVYLSVRETDRQTLENTEEAIKKGQSRETGNIGYKRQINVRFGIL